MHWTGKWMGMGCSWGRAVFKKPFWQKLHKIYLFLRFIASDCRELSWTLNTLLRNYCLLIQNYHVKRIFDGPPSVLTIKCCCTWSIFYCFVVLANTRNVAKYSTRQTWKTEFPSSIVWKSSQEESGRVRKRTSMPKTKLTAQKDSFSLKHMQIFANGKCLLSATFWQTSKPLQTDGLPKIKHFYIFA